MRHVKRKQREKESLEVLDEWEQACPTANWGLRGREEIEREREREQ